MSRSAKNSEYTGNVGKGKPPKDKQFKPGQSGNPHGRPKKIPAIDILLAEVLGEGASGETGAKQILDALHKRAKKGDVRAAELLLDRAYGKARQPIEHSITEKQIMVIGGQKIEF